jgi:hypothetical protein
MVKLDPTNIKTAGVSYAFNFIDNIFSSVPIIRTLIQ